MTTLKEKSSLIFGKLRHHWHFTKKKQLHTVDLEEGSSQGTKGTFLEEEEDDFPILCTMPPEVKYRSIYRVACWLKRVNPEAYTPQILLLGPLHKSKKDQARELSKTDCRYLGYLKMEAHKKNTLERFAHRYGEETVQGFKNIIQSDEDMIRGCYAESTKSIESDDFVKMMLQDSVFILVFLLQSGHRRKWKTGNFIIDEPCHQVYIANDLILLENQLPYLLLEKLFDPFIGEYMNDNRKTFRDLVLGSFDLEEDIKPQVEFLHFTDMLRRFNVQKLGITEEQLKIEIFSEANEIKSLPNSVQLGRAGVQFIADRRGSSDITFKRGILKVPCLSYQHDTESVLRNIMALEQCHYPFTAYTCQYIAFLNFLIDTEEDVEFLIRKGIITQGSSPEAVADMVNKLCLGVVFYGSYYYGIAKRLNDHYDSSLNRNLATLQQVYFKDLWTGTATIAAVIILILTLIGTVASVLQAKQQNDHQPRKL